MKAYFPALMRILSSRLARNIYFWLWLIYSRVEYKYTPLMAGFTAILFCVLALLFYGNNLVLIPRLLSKKKYGGYLLSYATLVLIVALLFTGTLKCVMHYHPDIKSWMISPLVHSVETPELSLASLLREARAYYTSLAAAGGIFALAWYIGNYRALQQRLEDVSKKHLQAELGFLKAQINPHFLFNTLNNLYTLTLRQSDKAPQVVAGLSTMMRYFLGESNVETISVKKEQEMMEAYIELELLRLSNKDGLHFDIRADRPYHIPPLLWLPVLENVFKHGARYISERYEADFRFCIMESKLRIYSRNTFKPAEQNAAAGIGLSNLRKRLQLLYPGRYEFRAGKEDAYFITEVNIRLA